MIIIYELESTPGYEEYIKNIDRLRRLYEMREDAIREYISAFNEARREGIAEGMAIAEAEERMTNAKNLLSNNIPLDIIVKSLHLTDKEVAMLTHE